MPFSERVGNSLFRYRHTNDRGPRFCALYSKPRISENFVAHFCVVSSPHDIGYRRIPLAGLWDGCLRRCERSKAIPLASTDSDCFAATSRLLGYVEPAEPDASFLTLTPLSARSSQRRSAQ